MIRIVLLLTVLGVLLGGCLMSAHNSECYRRCLHRHQTCVTGSRTPAALNRCDQYLARCREGCQW